INRFSVGVWITSQNNVVAGNFIGLSPDGRTALGNAEGIWAMSDSDTVLGGTAPADRNIVGGKSDHSMQGGEDSPPPMTSTNLSILGNYFGTDAAGMQSVPANDSSTAISIRSAERLTLGGLEAGAGNVISVGTYGIDLYSGSRGRVLGNRIG